MRSPLVPIYKSWAIVLFVAFFAAIAFVKYRPAFASDHTIAFNGDGWGTIGWIYELQERFASQGLGIVPGDTYFTDGIGGGLQTRGQPINPLWKFVYGISAYWFTPDNAYDAVAFGAFVFVGVAGAVLGLTLGLSFWVSGFMGILLVMLDHFQVRQAGHLTFAMYGFPILLVTAVIRLCNRPSGGNWILFSIVTVFNFLVNEYYGYFGAIVSLAIALPFMMLLFRSTGPQRLKSFGWVILSGAIILGLLLVFYPTLIGSKILALFGYSKDLTEGYAHNVSDFYAYSIRNPTLLFQPGTPWLRALLPSSVIIPNDVPEMTLRLGIVVPILALSGLVVLKRRNAIVVATVWLAGIIGYFLALSPKSPVALAHVTMAFAPMFRCSVRALLYTNIALIGLAGVAIQEYWDLVLRWKEANLGFNKIVLVIKRVAIVAIGYAAYADIVLDRSLYMQFPISELPRKPVHEYLANLPPGELVELPFVIPPKQHAEDDYPIFLARRIHHKPVVNGSPLDFRTYRLQHFFRVNDLPPDLGEVFGKAGIRYIIGRKDANYNVASLTEVKNVRELGRFGDDVLYEVQNRRDQYNHDVLKEILFEPTSFTFTEDHFRNDRRSAFPIQTPAVTKPFLLPNERHVVAKTHLPLQAGTYLATVFLTRKPSNKKTESVREILQWTLGEDSSVSAKNSILSSAFDSDDSAEASVMLRLLGDTVLSPDLLAQKDANIYVKNIVIKPIL